jgi:hypothetical protein
MAESETEGLMAASLIAQLRNDDPYEYLENLLPHELEQLAAAADELASCARLTISTGAHA